ncbi:MAG: MurR/RpiR family transcriptional regulator [Minwuiales bacterium]|nr:MurR/RpiR family transcriptional regulator [Minwuiales bacterium]
MPEVTASGSVAGADVTALLEAAYADLSPQLKRAARYVLDAPDEVALHSMRSVAMRAGVQPSTMSRLVRQLEFETYAAFREPFRERLRRHPPRYAQRARQLQTRSEPAEATGLLSEIVAADTNNIRQTFAETSRREIEAAVETLAAARRVFVVGMRKCFPVAYYFHYACRMFGRPVQLVQGAAGTFSDELRGIAADDVVIAIGFDPYTRETVQAVRDAVTARATVIAITDSAASPLGGPAQHCFVVCNDGPSFFRSLSAAISMAQTLVAFWVARGGDATIRSLAEAERSLVSHDAYWHEEPSS